MGFTDQAFNFHSQNFGLKVLKYALWRQVFTYFHRAIPPLNFETQEEKCVPISPLKCGYEVYGFNNPLNHKAVIYNLSVILSTRFAHLPLLCLWLVSWKPQCAETLKRSWVFIDHCVTLPSANLLGLSLPGKEGGREGGGKKEKTRREEGRGRENGKEGDREWGKEKVCVCVIFFKYRCKNIHTSHKNWFLLHQNCKLFLTERYDKYGKAGHKLGENICKHIPD